MVDIYWTAVRGPESVLAIVASVIFTRGNLEENSDPDGVPLRLSRRYRASLCPIPIKLTRTPSTAESGPDHAPGKAPVAKMVE